MRTVRIAFVAFSLCFMFAALAQVPTIIKEIDQIESQRDPKCYATANRLEDFIYGTSLDFDARAEKIALQKRLIRDLWLKATDAAKKAGKMQIGVDELRPVQQAAVPYVATPAGDPGCTGATSTKSSTTRSTKGQSSSTRSRRSCSPKAARRWGRSSFAWPAGLPPPRGRTDSISIT